jgi:hypothetical protein
MIPSTQPTIIRGSLAGVLLGRLANIICFASLNRGQCSVKMRPALTREPLVECVITTLKAVMSTIFNLV